MTPGETPRRGVARVDGGDVAYLDFGDPARAPDLVFLHANGFNALTYRLVLAPLAGALRILAPDLRGHGATTLPADPDGRTNWLDLRDDLFAFLDRLGVSRIALAGHSMGGTISVLAAAAAPERVTRIAVFDPVVMPKSRPGEREPTHWALSAMKRRKVFASRQAAFESFRRRGAFTTWPEAMVADYVAAGFKDLADGTVTLACDPAWELSNYVTHDHDTWGAFETSVCPVHVLRAESGSTFAPDPREASLTASGRVVIETVSGTTHFLPMERPERVREVLGEGAV